MPRNAPIIVLLVMHWLALMVAGFVTFKLRPDVAAMLREFGSPIGFAQRLALWESFLPAASALSVIIAILGLALPLKRSKRLGVVALGVTVVAVAAIFEVLALVLPIFAKA